MPNPSQQPALPINMLSLISRNRIMIEMISPTEFKLTNGCHQMTLRKCEHGGWEMLTINPATQAWNSYLGGRMSMPSYRRFNSLQGVEDHYKSWRGITAVVMSLDNNQLSKVA
jgi:hypothetical protein